MKKVLLSITALLFATGVFAQQEMGFGLKAGVNFPKYSLSDGDLSTGTATNFHITAFLDAPIATDRFYVQPGISLQGKGAKLSQTSVGTVKQNTMWIEVPVNFVAKFPAADAGNFFLGAGPYVAFGISGKNKYESDWASAEEDFDFGKDGDLKGTDFGLNFIGGFEFNNGLMIHGGYGLGLSNLAPDGNSGDIKQRLWTVGLGFRI